MATYDGDKLRIYVDGVLDGTSAAVGGSAVNPIGPGLVWRIGRRWDTTAIGGRSWYLGNIQHVAVYNRALSAAENTEHQDILNADPLAVLAPVCALRPAALPAGLEVRGAAAGMPLVPAGGGGGDPGPPVVIPRPGVGQTWPR